jgi:threonine/homoserine/homoserine lactone efflux protein
MDWTQILTFVFATTLLVTSPGPNGVLIAKTVPTSGPTAGFANIAGFFTAFYIHGTLSILGLSIILMNSAIAFAIVKYLGAAYLIWVGVKSLIAAFKPQGQSAPPTPARKRRTLARAFIEGLLTNGLNPKVSMFYLAAFPHFVPLNSHPVASAFLLVFLHSMINLIWFTVMVLVIAKLGTFARNGRAQRWLRGLTGVVFIGFGAKLATFRATF